MQEPKTEIDAADEIRRLRRRIAELEAAATERRSLARKLRRSDAGFRRLYESNVVGVIFADLEGNINEANDAFLEMVGYSRRDLPLRWDAMTPTEWRPSDEAKIAEIGATGFGKAWEKEYFRKDGSRVPILVGVALLEGVDGEAICFVLDLTERKETERQILEHKEKLRALASELALAEERERRRIGSGLHDHVGHPLVVAKMKVGQLLMAEPEAEIARPLAAIEDLLEDAINETRTLSFELSSPILYELGLVDALHRLGEGIIERHGIGFALASDLGDEELAEDIQVTLFRVVQELLFNVVKHAAARRVRLTAEKVGGEVRISVEDDGVGIERPEAALHLSPSGGLGLFGIRERLQHLGGSLLIEAGPTAGARVIATVPFVPKIGPEEEP